MIWKFGLTFVLLLLLQIFSTPIVSGQMEIDPSKDLSDLLKDEDKSKFFTNQRSGDFFENFEEREIQESSENNILIKSGTTIKLEGFPTLEYSTILVEGNLRIIDTGDSSLRVQKIIVGSTGSLTIGDEENPISDEKQVEIVFCKEQRRRARNFCFWQS